MKRERSAYHKARDVRLTAERKCRRCLAGLLDTEPYTACTECLERNRTRRSSKRALARDAAAAKKRYLANPDARRQWLRDYRLKKQVDGICRDCSLDALPNSDFCHQHRMERAASRRLYHQQKRAA